MLKKHKKAKKVSYQKPADVRTKIGVVLAVSD